jgi:hypothetical protein
LHILYYYESSLVCTCLFVCLLGPTLIGDGYYYLALDPTFGSFTLLELVSLVQVFIDSLHWNGFFWVVQSVGSLGRLTTSYLLGGPTCLWCLVCLCVCLYVTIFCNDFYMTWTCFATTYQTFGKFDISVNDLTRGGLQVFLLLKIASHPLGIITYGVGDEYDFPFWPSFKFCTVEIITLSLTN